ncbi:hypothetical protein GDO86_014862 [Hymenochirus boettgeri]|uniref:Inositol polyphosphate-related phosphatase domain-containing protein n=1 Tax=Hymenochirus boettgeri TaxID=247094 RepID=A0A8T2JW78_9PIPI|nr:hypothetical protein GDO86_014862 [Hymenochirus boettgeri]
MDHTNSGAVHSSVGEEANYMDQAESKYKHIQMWLQRQSLDPSNNQGTEFPHVPKPPCKPIHRPRRLERAFSLDEKHWRRRLKTSKESLMDPDEMGSSSGSLQEDSTPVDGTVNISDNYIRENTFDTSTDNVESSSHDPSRNLVKPSTASRFLGSTVTSNGKLRLTRIKPLQTLPQMELDITSRALRTSNRIDADYKDYRESTSQLQFLRQSTSETRLDDSSMVCNHCSNDSMKSTYSLLTPIRSKDVRNRSYLEGSLLGNGALLGAEELDRYFPERRLGIFIATWNMQGRKELPESLDDFLLPGDDDFAQDMYVIGVQEGCPDRREWEIRLQETLGPHYVLLHSSGHGVLYLSVFIRRDLIWFCSEVESATVTTRIVSQIKTKGALAVSFTFFGTSFLFITSHFTSGDTKVCDRILDYKKIIEGLQLPRNIPDTNPYRSNSADVTSRFDEVFWFGDFNFRLNKERNAVNSILQKNLEKDMSQLVQYDQLTKEMNEGQSCVQESTKRRHPCCEICFLFADKDV